MSFTLKPDQALHRLSAFTSQRALPLWAVMPAITLYHLAATAMDTVSLLKQSQ